MHYTLGVFSLVTATLFIAPSSYGQCVTLPANKIQCSITNGSPLVIPVFGLKQGSFVDMIATLDTSDPDENGEHEVLYVQELVGGTVVQEYAIPSYAQPVPLHFDVQGIGAALFQAYISGFDNDESATLQVSINKTQLYTFEDKQDASFLATQYASYGSGFRGVNNACLLAATGNPALAPICTTYGVGSAILGLLTVYEKSIAADPSDPHFRVIQKPTTTSFHKLLAQPGVTKQVANAFNTLYDNYAECIGLTRAIYISLNRAQGASDASEMEWQTAQQQAADLYTIRLGTLYKQQPSLLSNLQNALELANVPTFTVSASDVFAFESDIALNGLPADLQQLLTGLGADASAISDLTKLFLVVDADAASGNFPEKLTDPTHESLLQKSASDLAATVIPVSVSVPFKVDTGDRGLIPVFIDSTVVLKVHKDLEKSSLRFGRTGNEQSLEFCLPFGNRGDSLICLFRMRATGLRIGDTTAVLTGETKNESKIRGVAKVHICP